MQPPNGNEPVGKTRLRLRLGKRGRPPGQLPRIVAFTLVELLVVIAVMLMLISILLPALSKAKGVAQRSSCASNQRQMAVAFMSYAQDYNGCLPGWGWNTPSSTAYYWQQPLAPYLGYDAYLPYSASPGGRNLKVMECPAARGLYSSTNSYQWLYVLISNVQNPNVYRLSLVRSPSRKALCADHTYSSGDNSVQLDCYRMPVPYHVGAANFLYFDGHVAHYSSNALFTTPIGNVTYYYSSLDTSPSGIFYPYR